MKHKIEITQETKVSVFIEIEANTVEEAETIAEDHYIDGQYDSLFIEKESKNLISFEYFINTV